MSSSCYDGGGALLTEWGRRRPGIATAPCHHGRRSKQTRSDTRVGLGARAPLPNIPESPAGDGISRRRVRAFFAGSTMLTGSLERSRKHVRSVTRPCFFKAEGMN